MAPHNARDVAQLAARRASSIFRAVVRGPKPPAPAGWGVEPTKFRGALPWFRWRELTVFANHFAQHGSVANDLAVDLAGEISRRLDPITSASSEEATDSKKLSKKESLALPGSPQEVAAVVYAFSKLSPQLTEYRPLYSSLADGITNTVWKFSRLEAGLVGTALVDVQIHLDALPSLLRPVLQDLRRNALEAADTAAGNVTIDELRYLLHACTCLPSPGIKPEDIEVLASLTVQLVPGANFAKAAHLVVSWLRLRAPVEAKRYYLDALGATTAAISQSERPSLPAHPLLMNDLGSCLEELLAGEGHRDPPPITPPLVRAIVESLMQISRGALINAETKPPKGDALNFVDWVRIARVTIDFCDEHEGDLESQSSRTLPGWAADALGFVVSRARRPLAARDPPDLESLLTILQLLRRYRANPAPERWFFIWMARQLTLHHQSATDSATLAEIVGELVPQLPQAERAQFAKELFTRPRDAAPQTSNVSDTYGFPHDELYGVPQMHKGTGSESAAAVALAGTGSRSASPVQRLQARRFEQSSRAAMSAKGSGARSRLWDRLALDNGLEDERVRVEQESVLSSLAADVPKDEPAAVETIREAVSTSVSTMLARSEAEASEPQLANEELRLQLEETLKQIKAIEAKLEEQSCGFKGEMEHLRSRVLAAEQKAEQTSRDSEARMMPPSGEQMPSFQLPDFQSLFPDTRLQNESPSVSSSRATLHVRRPFSFDELRRAESQGLQNKRVRVLVPSDPMQPFPAK